MLNKVKIDDIFKEVAEEQDVSVSLLKDIFYHFWKQVKLQITDPRMPRVMVPYLGTFRPTVGRVNYMFRLWIKQARRGAIPKEQAIRRIRRYWPIRHRCKLEEQGAITYRDWKDGGVEAEKYLEKFNKEKQELSGKSKRNNS